MAFMAEFNPAKSNPRCRNSRCFVHGNLWNDVSVSAEAENPGISTFLSAISGLPGSRQKRATVYKDTVALFV